MTKAQALHKFWNSFGLAAYDENTVPDNPTFPYITYSCATDALGQNVALTASLWDYGFAWKTIQEKAEYISQYLYYGHPCPTDDGYVWIRKGSPFAQRLTDENPEIRRINLNINAEFLTAY